MTTSTTTNAFNPNSIAALMLFALDGAEDFYTALDAIQEGAEDVELAREFMWESESVCFQCSEPIARMLAALN